MNNFIGGIDTPAVSNHLRAFIRFYCFYLIWVIALLHYKRLTLYFFSDLVVYMTKVTLKSCNECETECPFIIDLAEHMRTSHANLRHGKLKETDVKSSSVEDRGRPDRYPRRRLIQAAKKLQTRVEINRTTKRSSSRWHSNRVSGNLVERAGSRRELRRSTSALVSFVPSVFILK